MPRSFCRLVRFLPSRTLGAGLLAALVLGGCGSTPSNPSTANTTDAVDDVPSGGMSDAVADSASDATSVSGSDGSADTTTAAESLILLACAKSVACQGHWATGSVADCTQRMGKTGDIERLELVAKGVINHMQIAQQFWPVGVTGCLSAATSCDEVSACGQTAPEPCSDNKVYCEDGAVVSCQGGQRWRHPCPAPTSCRATLDGEAAICSNASPCTGEGVSCDGDFALVCPPESAEGVKSDCGFFGRQCASGSSWKGSACVLPVVGPCDAGSFADSCDGTTAVHCGPNGITHMDCAKLGQVCGLDFLQEAECRTAPTGCVKDACVGDVLHTCLEGQPTALDCAAHGMKCVVGSDQGPQGDHCSW